MNKTKKLIVFAVIIFSLVVLYVSCQYKTKTGQELAKYVADFKRYTDISIQLNIYEDEAYELIEKYKTKEPTQAETENITSKCVEITEYINNNFDSTFENLDLYDEYTNITDILNTTRHSAIGNANSSLDECLDIIEESDYGQVKESHRFQGCITIINECFSNYDENSFYIATEDREKYSKMKTKFESTINELEN